MNTEVRTIHIIEREKRDGYTVHTHTNLKSAKERNRQVRWFARQRQAADFTKSYTLSLSVLSLPFSLSLSLSLCVCVCVYVRLSICSFSVSFLLIPMYFPVCTMKKVFFKI